MQPAEDDPPDRLYEMVASIGGCSTRHFCTAGHGCADYHLAFAPKIKRTLPTVGRRDANTTHASWTLTPASLYWS